MLGGAPRREVLSGSYRDEHAAFVASKDREKATRKLHDADKKRGAKAKKHKATTATGALE